MTTYRIKDVTEILNINSDAIYSYIRKALPESLKPEKTMQKDLGRETYEFTEYDIENLKNAIRLKSTGLTYKDVKESIDYGIETSDIGTSLEDKIQNTKQDTNETSSELESEEIMETDLTVIKQDGRLLIDSREVARMIDRDHHKVMRDMRGYADVLDINPDLDTSNFFIESTFKDSYDRNQPCYLLTRRGCDMVANKMTGEKGIIFTAMYVTKFEEMERQIQAPLAELSPQLQLLISMEMKQTEMETAITQTNTRIDGLKDVIALDTRSWRVDTKNLITRMAMKLGGYEHISDLRNQSYELLNVRMGVSLATRLTNKRRRMAEEGISKSKRDKLNPLDVIAEDKKLIEGYVAIVKEMSIKYDVSS